MTAVRPTAGSVSAVAPRTRSLWSCGRDSTPSISPSSVSYSRPSSSMPARRRAFFGCMLVARHPRPRSECYGFWIDLVHLLEHVDDVVVGDLVGGHDRN